MIIFFFYHVKFQILLTERYGKYTTEEPFDKSAYNTSEGKNIGFTTATHSRRYINNK